MSRHHVIKKHTYVDDGPNKTNGDTRNRIHSIRVCVIFGNRTGVRSSLPEPESRRRQLAVLWTGTASCFRVLPWTSFQRCTVARCLLHCRCLQVRIYKSYHFIWWLFYMHEKNESLTGDSITHLGLTWQANSNYVLTYAITKTIITTMIVVIRIYMFRWSNMGAASYHYTLIVLGFLHPRLLIRTRNSCGPSLNFSFNNSKVGVFTCPDLPSHAVRS